jgi:polyisoprenoid-binding protein YceI
MKRIIVLLVLALTTGSLFAQKLTTTSATVTFDATTPKDALPKAENKSVIAALDKKTGELQFEAAVNNFSFTNPTIQAHFNEEKWMNSASFPKFTFNGKIKKLGEAKFHKNGTYDIDVVGDLTVRGVTKSITVPAIITVKGDAVSATSSFKIKLSDFGITGNPIDGGKVSNEPKITVAVSF